MSARNSRSGRRASFGRSQWGARERGEIFALTTINELSATTNYRIADVSVIGQSSQTTAAPSPVSTEDDRSVWECRWDTFVHGSGFVLGIFAIYLGSESAIWGFSRALAPLKVEYFASILGMLITFFLMTVYMFSSTPNNWYQVYLKSKVDFINSHLGLGFPIPLIMLDVGNMLSGAKIARIIGNFLATNVISWLTVYAAAYYLTTAASWIRFRLARPEQTETLPEPNGKPSSENAPSSGDVPSSRWESTLTGVDGGDGDAPGKAEDSSSQDSPVASQRGSMDVVESPQRYRSAWTRLEDNYPIFLSLAGAAFIGLPVAALAGDYRALDGFVLWFLWMATVRSQRGFKKVQFSKLNPDVTAVLATLFNPVLMTTLLATGYTRIRAALYHGDLTRVLSEFSRGTPLYAIWTSSVTGTDLPNNPDHYFGAGDLALSILECGILIWGFKLYECRRQLFSVAGLLTVLVSVAAAAANVFLCVFTGHAMGLDEPEALAFAARSTTLALAKPAIEAVGGDLTVNAALVVTNGIIGQLVYPFVLSKMKVATDAEPETADTAATQNTEEGDNPQQLTPADEDQVEEAKRYDTPATIAAGIAIGINGAAMGVAYLYETKSRAAPFAALAMTVFGVMTVVFTTVEPFRGIVVGLASF